VNKQENITQNVNLILTRLKRAVNVNSDRELAEKMGLAGTNVFTNWRERGVSFKTIVTYCVINQISCDYIFGIGSVNHEDKIVISEPLENYSTKSFEAFMRQKISQLESEIFDLKQEIKTLKKGRKE
jgi:transcriptional regulator with XRE-family HTH domain